MSPSFLVVVWWSEGKRESKTGEKWGCVCVWAWFGTSNPSLAELKKPVTRCPSAAKQDFAAGTEGRPIVPHSPMPAE